jgi:hypothetical protein
MKKLAILAMMLVVLSGCTRSTDFGKCIGITDDKKPGLEYSVSYWNVFLGFIFSWTAVVPVVVAVDSLRCPVGLDTPTK